MEKQRDAFFDNAKYLLIFLVVFGHIISPIKDQSDILYALYKFVYLFHMPAFILIAGYFAKGFKKPGHLRKTMRKTVVPYLFFQFIYTFFYYYTGLEDTLAFTIFSPHWTLWFLLSLFFWHVMLRVIVKFPYPLLIAAVIGVGAGYVSQFGSFLSSERTLVFFPFFLLGYLLERRHFDVLKEKATAFAAPTLLIGIFAICFTVIPDSAKEWLWSSASYSDLGVSGIKAAVLRLAFYTLMLLATFSFLAIVPRKKLPFTKLGAYTLYIYLLHGFIIKIIGMTVLDGVHSPALFLLAVFIGAHVICFLLASQPVRTLFKPLIECRVPKSARQLLT